MKIGDIITAFTPGYHEVVAIIPRSSISPLVEYRTIINGKGKILDNSKAIKGCDNMLWCNVLNEQDLKDMRDDEHRAADAKFDALITAMRK